MDGLFLRFQARLCCSKVGGSKHGIKIGCGTARPCRPKRCRFFFTEGGVGRRVFLAKSHHLSFKPLKNWVKTRKITKQILHLAIFR